MSLVGTRPILQDELLKYELHHRARIAIKPGITGMWQVSGRSDITDFEEVVRLDTEYISKYPTFTFVKGNIADKELITELFEKYKPSVVVNLAAQAGVTYIYGMFYRFGLIDVPDEVKEKMGHPKTRKK
jgi:hypothetical protein